MYPVCRSRTGSAADLSADAGQSGRRRPVRSVRDLLYLPCTADRRARAAETTSWSRGSHPPSSRPLGPSARRQTSLQVRNVRPAEGPGLDSAALDEARSCGQREPGSEKPGPSAADRDCRSAVSAAPKGAPSAAAKPRPTLDGPGCALTARGLRRPCAGRRRSRRDLFDRGPSGGCAARMWR